MGRATDIGAGVTRAHPKDQQAEETDGESTTQVATVRDLTCVQHLVTMVIGQSSSLLWAV